MVNNKAARRVSQGGFSAIYQSCAVAPARGQSTRIPTTNSSQPGMCLAGAKGRYQHTPNAPRQQQPCRQKPVVTSCAYNVGRRRPQLHTVPSIHPASLPNKVSTCPGAAPLTPDCTAGGGGSAPNQTASTAARASNSVVCLSSCPAGSAGPAGS